MWTKEPSLSLDLFNQEAESIALAGIVREPKNFWAINEPGLTSDDFVGQENRRVMKAIIAVVGDKNEPDIPLLIEELRVTDNTTTVEYLHKLSSLPASLAQAKSSAKVVKTLAVRRRLATAAAGIIEIAEDRTEDIEVSLAKAHAELRKVDEAMPHDDSSPDPLDILMKMREAPPEARASIGFSPSLDGLIGGLFPKNIWVIGGFSSVGKSAVAVNFVYDVLRQDRWVGVISTEMAQDSYMRRLLSLASNISQKQIRDRVTLSLEEADRMKKAEGFIGRSNLRIYDDVYQLQSIRSTAMRMKETTGLDLLVVDFIQNVRASTGDFAFGDMTEVVLDLQQLAKDLDCTVIALSQLANDMAKDRMKGEGTGGYYGFKGSGAIKDAADVAILLDRQRASEQMDFDVVKNRHGEGAGRVIPMTIDLPTGRIREDLSE